MDVDVATEHYDLVEETARTVSRRFRLPARMDDDLVSAGNEAIVRAAADPGLERAADVRSWLGGCVYYGMIDELRSNGKPGSLRYVERLRSLSLDAPLEGRDGAGLELELAAPDDVVDETIAAATLRDLLAACPNDRYREVVVRAAAGEPNVEIGRRLGVGESRVSQMLTAVRRRLDHGRAWPSVFPPGSWR